MLSPECWIKIKYKETNKLKHGNIQGKVRTTLKLPFSSESSSSCLQSNNIMLKYGIKLFPFISGLQLGLSK